MNGYSKVLSKIKETAEKNGRYFKDIKLVVVSKNRNIEEIMNIYNQGQRIFAENRIQEATEKIPHLPDDIEWHLIGHLQSNKAKNAVELFRTIQSVDSLKIAEAINKFAEKNEKIIKCLIEVKISDEDTKFGVDIEDVENLLKTLSNLKNLQVEGLMGMAPFINDINKIRASFSKLKSLFDNLKNTNIENVDMKWLSMGMSSDYEIAIEEGANMVRIGTAVFEN